MLETLRIRLDWSFQITNESLNLLKAMLISWNAPVPLHQLYLPWEKYDILTRESYMARLRCIAPILREWIRHSPVLSSIDSEVSEQRTQRTVCVELCDLWDKRDWWWTRLKEGFPTLVELDQLCMAYEACECSSDFVHVASTYLLQFISIQVLARWTATPNTRDPCPTKCMNAPRLY